MATRASDQTASSEFWRGLKTQGHVIGALIMRELHTRYGRENVGYLWVIGEPLMFGTMIALLHAGEKTHYAGDIRPVPFAVVGYCIFIMFRGIFNRAEGSLEANMPLMYHKMVTVFDIMLSRAILEGVGTLMSYVILVSFITSIGLCDLPARPLYLLLGMFFMFAFSFAMSLIIVSATHENRLLARFVHPFTYIMMPLSGAFYQVKWIPEPYRSYLEWFPLAHIFELARYGQFAEASSRYFSIPFLTACTAISLYIGLVMIKLVRNKVHLS